MHVLSTVVLLTAVVIAQADEMSDVLKLPAIKDHVYIIDVTTEASVDDLKASLVNFTIDDWYKVLGEQRYLIVFISSDSAALDSLTFPAGSQVTQMVVVHVRDYLDTVKAGRGIEDKHNSLKKNPDTVLIYFDMRRRWSEAVCPEHYELQLQGFTEEYRESYKSTISTVYAFVANHPPRFVEFEETEQNAFQNLIRKAFSTVDGYGEVELTIKRVVRVLL